MKPRPILPLIACSALLIAVSHAEKTTSPDAWVSEVVEFNPTNEQPFKIPASETEEREKWKRLVKDFHNLPAGSTPAHPGANAFPGSVAPDAERITGQVFTVDANMPRWQSTGLYVPPGEVVTVNVPPELAALGASAVIGCHKDAVFRREVWKRFPVITRNCPLKKGENKIANAFGGLLYISLPRDQNRGGLKVNTYGGYSFGGENVTTREPATHEVTISGAVRSPLFIPGKTDLEDWKAQLAQTGAPWGEIAGKHLILSLPVSVLRENVTDPGEIAAYWDRVMDAAWDFTGWPGERKVPERFVADIQISVGWLHSGHPFCGHLVHSKEVVDIDTLNSEGSWGFFHEIGHNHQGQFYTFGSSFTEVTVNLHTLYIMDSMLGLAPEDAKKWNPKELFQKALQGDKSPFAMLTLYLPLIEEFGYPAFIETFGKFWDDPQALSTKDHQAKIDAFVPRFSSTVGKNCAPYFAKFGITCSPESLAELKTLPVWIPDKKWNFTPPTD